MQAAGDGAAASREDAVSAAQSSGYQTPVPHSPAGSIAGTRAGHLNLGSVSRNGGSMRAGSAQRALGSRTRTPSMSSTAGTEVSANLGILSRQYAEVVEARLGDKLKQLEHRLLTSDRSSDNALNRLELKVADVDKRQQALDRGMAELTGARRGHSEDIQSQLRRVEQLDQRMWEWKHSIEDMLKNKMVEMQQLVSNQESNSSSSLNSSEDTLQRLLTRFQRIEDSVEEELKAQNDSLHQAHADMISRVGHLEAHQAAFAVLSGQPRQPVLFSPMSTSKRESPEKEADEMAFKVAMRELTNMQDLLNSNIKETADMHLKVNTHEEAAKQLRSRIDTFEGSHRKLCDRVGTTDCVSTRFKDLERSHHEHKGKHSQYSQDLGNMISRFETLHTAHKEADDKLGHLNRIVMEEVGVQQILHPLPINDLSFAPAPRIDEGGASDGKLDELSRCYGELKGDMELLRRDEAILQALSRALQQVPQKLTNLDEEVSSLWREVRIIRSRKADKPRSATIVQWNLAGVNSNALEFHQSQAGIASVEFTFEPGALGLHFEDSGMVLRADLGGQADLLGIPSGACILTVNGQTWADSGGARLREAAGGSKSYTIAIDKASASLADGNDPVPGSPSSPTQRAALRRAAAAKAAAKEAGANAESQLAVKVVAALDRLIKSVVGCSSAPQASQASQQLIPRGIAERLAKLTASDLLTPLHELATSHETSSPSRSSAIKGILAAAPKDEPFVNMLAKIRAGGKELGKAEMKLSGWRPQRFSLLRLTVETSSEVVQMCSSGDRRRFWRQLVEQVVDGAVEGTTSSSSADAKEKTSAQMTSQELALYLPFEGFLFEALHGLLSEDEAHGGLPRSEQDVEAVKKSMAAFVGGMCCDNLSKAGAVGRALESVSRQCNSDVICLQEFNTKWCSLESFCDRWNALEKTYHTFKPRQCDRPEQVVILMIRRDGIFSVDEAATASVVDDLLSVAGSQRKGPTVWAKFDRTYRGQNLGGVDKVGGIGDESETAQKLAVAVCRVDGRQTPVLVVAAHCMSDGTNNCAICRFARSLAEAHGYDLIMALDANSAAVFPEQDMLNGATPQSGFLPFLEADGFKHCHSDFSSDVVRDANRFHTVSKTRTYMQCQLKKAGKQDVSAKDFVLIAGGLASENKKFEGRRVNKFDWLSKSRQGLPPESETWSDDAEMPAPGFPSDHAMVIAEVEL